MSIFRRARSRTRKSKGQTAVEYALLLAGVAAAAMAGYSSLGASTNAAVNSASALLASSDTATASGSGSGSGSAGSGSGGSGSGGGHHHHGGGGGWGGGGWGGHHWF
jgi:Flp pilus assembly pilin Flp